MLVAAVLGGVGAWLALGGDGDGGSTPADDTDAGAPVEESATWARIERGPRTDPRPDILLFTIDTLRADHVESYGYDRRTAPVMTELARHATRFERAYSSSSWTVPAVASLLTGVLPSEHGVQHGFWLDFTTVAHQELLPEAIPTLASSLHDAGYRTVGVAANVHLAAPLGFGRGFDSYTSLDFLSGPDQVHAALAPQLDGLRDGDAPYFLWVHLVDPHAPYAPRAPSYATFRPPHAPEYPALSQVMLEELMIGVMLREHIPLADGMAYVTAAYDSEIHAADAYLGQLLGELDDGHLAVVVTSDHGEELQDHLRMGHGHTAFEEVVHVPMFVALPDGEARTVPDVVSIVDVMPTLLELASATPTRPMTGRSLLPLLRGEALPPRDAIIETGRGDEVVQAIVAEDIKYGERLTPRPLRGMYDLSVDPRETRSLVDERPEVAASLRARMTEAIAAAAARRPETSTVEVELTDAQRAQLRALGYAE